MNEKSIEGIDLDSLLAVLTSLRDGDFSPRLPARDPCSADGRVATALNAALDVLECFAREQRRITRELGVDGRLGGQAEVPGAAGAWAEMVDGLNRLEYGLTNQLRRVNAVARALRDGRPVDKADAADVGGEVLDLRDNVNALVDRRGIPARWSH